MAKEIKFALLYIGSGKLVQFYTDNDKHSDEKSCANILLRLALKEDGKEFNMSSMKLFLEEYAEYMNENLFDDREDHTASDITDYVADNIVHCNAPHIISIKNRTQVSNEFSSAVCIELKRMLDKSLIPKS